MTIDIAKQGYRRAAISLQRSEAEHGHDDSLRVVDVLLAVCVGIALTLLAMYLPFAE